MKYAVIFCLFFTLDILLLNRFLLFGMMPVDGLMAAVFLYAGNFFLKIPVLPRLIIAQPFKLLWIFQLFFLFISRMMISTSLIRRYFKFTQAIVDFFWDSSIFRLVMVLFAVILIVVFYVSQKYRYKLHLWITIFLTAVIFRYGFRELVKMYAKQYWILLYRYQGFIDLPMLFAILMCVHVAINERYRYEYQLETEKLITGI